MYQVVSIYKIQIIISEDTVEPTGSFLFLWLITYSSRLKLSCHWENLYWGLQEWIQLISHWNDTIDHQNEDIRKTGILNMFSTDKIRVRDFHIFIWKIFLILALSSIHINGQEWKKNLISFTLNFETRCNSYGTSV